MMAFKKVNLVKIGLLVISITVINIYMVSNRTSSPNMCAKQDDDASTSRKSEAGDTTAARALKKNNISAMQVSDKQTSKFVSSYKSGFAALKRMQDESMYSIQGNTKLPLLRLSEAENDFKYRTAHGRLWMKQTSVVFAGTARNAKDQLPRNMVDIHRLGKMFKNYWIVFVENDSKDGTREYLMNVVKEYNQTIILGCEPINSPTECQLNIQYRSGKLHKPGWAQKRSDEELIDRGVTMSVLRNMILDYIYAHLADKAELMIAIEPDISWDPWNLDNVAQGIYYFSSRPQLDLLCANGRLWGKLYDPCSRTYYAKKHFVKVEEDDHSIVTDAMAVEKNKVPIKVDSCYQAFAIYRISSLMKRNAHYYPVPGEWSCEHNTLARRLSEKYIDPAMFLNIYSLVVHSKDRW